MEINPEPTPLTAKVDFFLEGKIRRNPARARAGGLACGMEQAGRSEPSVHYSLMMAPLRRGIVIWPAFARREVGLAEEDLPVCAAPDRLGIERDCAGVPPLHSGPINSDSESEPRLNASTLRPPNTAAGKRRRRSTSCDFRSAMSCFDKSQQILAFHLRLIPREWLAAFRVLPARQPDLVAVENARRSGITEHEGQRKLQAVEVATGAGQKARCIVAVHQVQLDTRLPPG